MRIVSAGVSFEAVKESERSIAPVIPAKDTRNVHIRRIRSLLFKTVLEQPYDCFDRLSFIRSVC